MMFSQKLIEDVALLEISQVQANIRTEVLSRELADCEAARQAERAEAQAVEASLRADLATARTAAYKLSELWRSSSVEGRLLSREVSLLEDELSKQCDWSSAALQTGYRVTELRFRQVEQRRLVETRALRAELAVLEGECCHVAMLLSLALEAHQPEQHAPGERAPEQGEHAAPWHRHPIKAVQKEDTVNGQPTSKFNERHSALRRQSVITVENPAMTEGGYISPVEARHQWLKWISSPKPAPENLAKRRPIVRRNSRSMLNTPHMLLGPKLPERLVGGAATVVPVTNTTHKRLVRSSSFS